MLASWLNRKDLNRYFTEFVGTFILVFVGTGAIVIDVVTGGTVGNLGIGLTFGLIVMAVIIATGHISGAHINPAVTLAFALTRHFPKRDILPYWIAQLAGACAAGAIVLGLFGDVRQLGATLPRDTASQAFIIEFFLTTILMFVIMAVATDARIIKSNAAIAIGAVVALEATYAGPITGASMNPARSFGPSLVSGYFADQWVYWLGPILGALFGAFLYKFIHRMDGAEDHANA
ncbi:MAG: MIP family channel protein [Chloroflexi bacterium]|nr:MIP family channel protein [Chloroflexota bacterium]